MSDTATLTMPRTNRSAKRDDKAVKIARDLASKAKMIADTRGEHIAEYLSHLLRPLIEKDFDKAVTQLRKPPQKEE